MIEVLGVIEALKSVIGIAKGAYSSKEEQGRNEGISQILDIVGPTLAQLVAIHAQYRELGEENSRLKDQVVQFNQWEETKAKYHLVEPHRGVFVFVANDNQQSTGPLHWLCPNCFERREKSYIQATSGNDYTTDYKCHCCSVSFTVSRRK